MTTQHTPQNELLPTKVVQPNPYITFIDISRILSRTKDPASIFTALILLDYVNFEFTQEERPLRWAAFLKQLNWSETQVEETLQTLSKMELLPSDFYPQQHLFNPSLLAEGNIIPLFHSPESLKIPFYMAQYKGLSSNAKLCWAAILSPEYYPPSEENTQKWLNGLDEFTGLDKYDVSSALVELQKEGFLRLNFDDKKHILGWEVLYHPIFKNHCTGTIQRWEKTKLMYNSINKHLQRDKEQLVNIEEELKKVPNQSKKQKELIKAKKDLLYNIKKSTKYLESHPISHKPLFWSEGEI